MITAVEQALQEATGITPKKKESRQDYLKRLTEAIGTLEGDDWDGLAKTPGAQEWFNDEASEAYTAKKEIPDFKEEASEEDDDETSTDAKDSAEDDKDEESEVDEEKAPKGKAKKSDKGEKKGKKEKEGKDEKPVKTAKATKKAEKEGRRAGAVKLRSRLYELVIKDPSASKHDLLASLKKEGFKVRSIGGMRRHFLHSVAFLQERKLLTRELLKD